MKIFYGVTAYVVCTDSQLDEIESTLNVCATGDGLVFVDKEKVDEYLRLSEDTPLKAFIAEKHKAIEEWDTDGWRVASIAFSK